MKKEEDAQDNNSEGGDESGDDTQAQRPRRKQVECIMGNFTEEELKANNP